jgi:SanA protein
MSKRKILLFSFLLVGAIVLMCIYLCNRIIENTAKGKLYSNVREIPFNKVGILLGTSKYLASGEINAYYSYRIDAAASLIKTGKIRYIIVSGNNNGNGYNEPAQMKADLIEAGIDTSIIFPDYAGFRTFDSMIRLKEIFSQDSVTVISQAFHNARALFIASKEGIEAIGFNAKDVNITGSFWVQVREKLARVKVFIDYLTGNKPKFLGNKVHIP